MSLGALVCCSLGRLLEHIFGVRANMAFWLALEVCPYIKQVICDVIFYLPTDRPDAAISPHFPVFCSLGIYVQQLP